jgi:hypothetical protein
MLVLLVDWIAEQRYWDQEYDRVLREKADGWEEAARRLDGINDTLAGEQDEIEIILKEKHGVGRYLVSDEVLEAKRFVEEATKHIGLPPAVLRQRVSASRQVVEKKLDEATAKAKQRYVLRCIDLYNSSPFIVHYWLRCMCRRQKQKADKGSLLNRLFGHYKKYVEDDDQVGRSGAPKKKKAKSSAPAVIPYATPAQYFILHRPTICRCLLCSYRTFPYALPPIEWPLMSPFLDTLDWTPPESTDAPSSTTTSISSSSTSLSSSPSLPSLTSSSSTNDTTIVVKVEPMNDTKRNGSDRKGSGNKDSETKDEIVVVNDTKPLAPLEGISVQLEFSTMEKRFCFVHDSHTITTAQLLSSHAPIGRLEGRTLTPAHPLGAIHILLDAKLAILRATRIKVSSNGSCLLS